MSSMRSYALPGEITDSIIDCLADNWRSLAKCALVCAAWRVRAGYRLSRGVTLTIGRHSTEAAADFRDLPHFVRTFCAGSQISDLIIALTMEGAAGSSVFASGDLSDDVDFSALRNLRSLTLCNINVSTGARLRTLYTSFPLLEELSLDGVFNRQVLNFRRARHGDDDYTYPPLSTVRLRSAYSLGTVAHVLRDDLRLPSLSATVRMLSIDLPRGYLVGWEETIQTLQGTLREIRVHLWPELRAAGVGQSSTFLSVTCETRAHLC
ncbi:hypothetical protein BV20DRAFT_975643 [Pilatotrama ljubarskyi]|nr:hypothetical protein BV20DRAFT_975643 [Pilatotrama ljubarskyi]